MGTRLGTRDYSSLVPRLSLPLIFGCFHYANTVWVLVPRLSLPLIFGCFHYANTIWVLVPRLSLPLCQYREGEGLGDFVTGDDVR